MENLRGPQVHLSHKGHRVMELKKGSTIYFMGIGGTGMAAVAGLCQEAGFRVIGSDNAMYPPITDCP